MAGDYSRQTHDPRKRFAAVLMQQGRVQVDADWNEQAEIVQERIRRQARDTFGRAAVSRFSTDQAFRIGIIAGPPRDLSIQPGRMYVEGLLAEAFAEDGKPISYLKQPFLPDPLALPTGGGANVFLDVWQREVTWVEDPSLLDVALGGVDTAARLQTVWQVRVAAARQAACGAPLDAASPARLTTRAVAPPAPEDPCLIAPKTGYRGLENRLYRVEVHAGGATSAARFKFSRDNASIRSPVLGMRKEMRGSKEVSILTVARIGRDPALRIAAGDWVEITDEHRFLNGESGAMAQVAEPPLEEAGQDGFAVVLDRVIPETGGRAFGATAAALAARRTRIIRWDQAAPRNSLDANGLMSVAGGMIALEEGVEVDFTLDGAGAQFRAGDWWVFAARTADASVEELSAAPPHGPIHHVAQLAAVANVSGNDEPSDCRTLWPPLTPQGGEGCCTVVVRPGEDIQSAIDSLPQEGGCVCLKAGVHPLRAALMIRRSRVSLHAEAPGAAVLTRAGEVPHLRIGGAAAQRAAVTDVTISGIVFQLGSLVERKTEGGLLMIDASAQRVHVSHCRFLVQDFGGGVAAVFTEGRDVTIEASIVERLLIGVRAEGETADLAVHDCVFIADPSDEAGTARLDARLPASDAGFAAVVVLACGGALRVTGNTAIGYRIGILAGTEQMGGKSLGTTLALIADNIVLRSGPAAEEEADTPAVAAPPTAPPSGTLAGRDAVVVSRERAEISAEAMRVSRTVGTTRVSSLPPGLAIDVSEHVTAAMSRLTAGTGTGPITNAAGTSAGTATTTGATNATTGVSTTVGTGLDRIPFAIIAAAQNATVSENVMAWRTGPYGGVLAGQGARLVTGNDIVVASKGEGAEALSFGIASGLGGAASSGVEIIGNMVSGRAYAVALNGCEAGLVAGNVAVGAHAGVIAIGGEGVRIDGNGAFGCRIGVMTVDVTRVAILGNVIAASAQQGILGLHSGKVAGGRLAVSGNTLVRCGVDATSAVALSFAAMDHAVEKEALVDSTEVVIEHNAIHDTGWPLTGERARIAQAISLAAPRVTVHGNDVSWSNPARTDEGLKILSDERAKPHRAIVVIPLAAQGFPPANDQLWAASVAITDNRVRGPSVDTLVEVREGIKTEGDPPRFRQALVTGNVVEHWGPLDSPGNAATVSLRVTEDALVSVSANVIRGSGRTPSVRVEGPKQVAWAGNATSGQLTGSNGVVNVVA
ncbi:DUF6519 domain-containing protein [Elioraea sp.]|uniref:DUF6519 domain-containing protein n=1 Tax=Elioraea sp. TaxID=2185103 RepID=UPI0025C16CAF|nr:DUF6519 domain-containing protein [Elioraea sp.]